MTEPILLMLCVMASGLPPVELGGDRITLVWQHSVEKTECREDWFLTEAGLIPGLARIRGSGAGLSIPHDARLIDGWWVYRPALPPLPGLTLARSGATPSDWLLCQETLCQPLETILPGLPDFEPVALMPCARTR